MGITMLGKVMGLVRDMLLGHNFGTGMESAAFLTASRIPRTFFDAIFAGIHICFSGFFAAYGRSYIGFAHNVLAVALIRVPGAWLLSNAYSDTLFPMGIASPCGSILSAVICVVAFTVLNRRGAFDKLVA